jgi:hypothetical protein
MSAGTIVIASIFLSWIVNTSFMKGSIGKTMALFTDDEVTMGNTAIAI